MKKGKRFEGYSLRTTYPQRDVADHEILLSFHSDGFAEEFIEWWEHGPGAVLFQEWMNKRDELERR